MKIILSLFVVLIACVGTFNVVTSEPRHSTEKEMRYALNEAVHSVIKTDNYFSSVENKSYTQIADQIKICENELEQIKLIRKINLGYESNIIVALAQIIVMSRNNFLHSTQSYIVAFKAGDKADCEYYFNKAAQEYTDAEKYRKQFREYTGY